MTDILCKIKITIKDFYPKLKIIPYNDYDCIIAYDNNKFIIPLKNYETIFFDCEPEKINSDLSYNISLISNENKYLISNASLIIPYIRIIQVIKIKKIKYEQQIKFLLENNIKERIFGPGSSVGSIFLRFNIEINGIKSQKSNILISDDFIKIRSGNSKNKFKSHSNFNLSVTNLSVTKNKDKKKITEVAQRNRLTTKNSLVKSNERIKNHTSINKQINDKYKYIYTQTSPFTLRNYYKEQCNQLFNEKKSKNNCINFNCLSPQKNIKKLYSNDFIHNKNINLKKYSSNSLYTNIIYNKKNNKNQIFLINFFIKNSIIEKKELKRHKKQKKKFIKKFFSQDINKKYITINKENYNNDNDDTNYNNDIKILNKNNSIEFDKSKNIKKKNISKKASFKIVKKRNVKNVEKKNTKNDISNDIENSSQKINKMESLKSKTTKNFSKRLKLNNIYKKAETKEIKENKKKKEIKENKEQESINLNESKLNIKNISNFKKIANTQEDLKNNIITLIDYFYKRNKETKKSYLNNIDYIDDKYLLYREKIILENKKLYSLQSQNNTKDFKNFIHVKINSKYNNVIFNKINKNKIKKINLINIILNNKNKQNNQKKIIQEKLKQQKQIHVLLNIIRNLIKVYGYFSHLYNNDNNKIILIKSLFLRYNIREKEWNENNKLIDLYHKMINDRNKAIYKRKSQDELKKDFKTIKEEENEEEDINDKNKEKIIEEEISEESEEENKKEENYKDNDADDENEEDNKEENYKGNEDERKEEKEEKKENTNNNKNNLENNENNNEIKIMDEKENINDENINKNDKNIKESNILEIKENILKSSINFDENVNTNNINTDLLNKNNIIINNFIINK